MSTTSFLYSQLFVKPPIPTHDFSGQTIIITGANTGLGFEAAKYFVQLNAVKVVLGVRSVSKGLAAKYQIEESTNTDGIIDVYHLDMEHYNSVKKFATQVAKLSRVDAVILNAGKVTQDFFLAEDNESTITVNVVSTMLLAMLLLPTLQSSARRWSTCPRLHIVASDRHVMTNLPEWKTADTFDTLNDPNRAKMHERYYVSKLLQILCMRALAKWTLSEPRVAISASTPGLCSTGLTRDIRGLWKAQLSLMIKCLARTSQEGGRILVHAVSLGWESHGKYLNDCKIDDGALSEFVRSPEGAQAEEKVWKELMVKVEKIEPHISAIVSS